MDHVLPYIVMCEPRFYSAVGQFCSYMGKGTKACNPDNDVTDLLNAGWFKPLTEPKDKGHGPWLWPWAMAMPMAMAMAMALAVAMAMAMLQTSMKRGSGALTC